MSSWQPFRAISIVCLWGFERDLGWRIAVPECFSLAAIWLAYKAAIASALGFGQALKEASAWLARNRPTETSARS